MSLARRVAITLSVPVLLALVARIPLPGVELEAVVAAGGRAELFGVLALGLVPYLTAAWLVELAAFLVPRWSRLRHGGPEGRHTLEKWSLRLAFVFAFLQGFSVAKNLESLESAGPGAEILRAPGLASTIAIMFAAAGGLALQLFFARVITRQGIANGVVVLFGVALGRELLASLLQILGAGKGAMMGAALTPFGALRVVLIAVTVAVATFFVTRTNEGDRGKAPAADGPYRDAKRFVSDPEIPVPASSVQPYAFAITILAIPSTLGALGVPGFTKLARLVDDPPVFFATGVAISIAAALVIAWVLHRPREIAELSRGLGGSSVDATTSARAALRRATPATLVYVGGLFFASAVMVHASALSIALFTAIVLDVGQAALALRRTADMVPVWEERRAVALPIAREALRADGISVVIGGTRLLALLQVFAPYAPAVLFVARADEERARAVLRHVLAGGEAPEPRAEGPLPQATKPTARPLVPVAVTFVVGALLAGIAGYSPSPASSGPRPVLELVRVDDDDDPLRAFAKEDPPVPGVSVRMESIPGPKGSRMVHYAYIPIEGTTREAALAGAGPWLATVPKPDGTRFGFEDVLEASPDGETQEVVAVRSFLLTGKPEITSDDVKNASLAPSTGEQVGIAVALTEDGAARFEALTSEWTKKRLAIVLDGKVMSAPVIMSAIAGGHLTITMGHGDREREMAEAKRLVAAFAR